MKKLITLLFLAIATINMALAQKDVQAKNILNQMSTKYRTYNSLKTDFTFTLDNPQAGAKQTQNGSITAATKTGKFKVTLFDADNKALVEQEIISDGKTQWTYLKKDKEVQVNNAGKSDDDLNPAQLFTLYEHGYKYMYTGEQKLNGKLYKVVDLSPESAGKTFFKIRLLIDKVTKQLYSAMLFDKSGSRYTYTLNTITPNVKVPDTIFAFDAKAHPGVEVVDLR